MVSLSFLVYFFAVILLTATMLVVSHFLNPQIPKRKNQLPFESGIVPTGSTDLRWNVNYYLVAILFVIFDIEAVFLYIWAIVVLETGWLSFMMTCLFIFILIVALVYEWRMGVLEWGTKLSMPWRPALPVSTFEDDETDADPVADPIISVVVRAGGEA